MKTFFVTLLLSSLLFASFSCQKQGIEIAQEKENIIGSANFKANSAKGELTTFESISFKVKPLHPKQIKDIAKKLQGKVKKTKKTSVNKMYEEVPTDEEVILTEDEQEIRTIINPLVLNGQQIYNEIKSNIVNTGEWNSLSEEEKNEILNINTESQFTDLALVFSVYSYQNDPTLIEAMRINWETIHDCVGVALGLNGIRDVVTGIFTVEKGISLLRIIGKRYLSYIGIAWMIWDFTDCIAHFV